jgi:tricorn protease
MNTRFFVSALLLGSLSMVHAEDGRLLRFPTTNGTEVVFSYAGDLYKAPINGGEAVRLTSHVGYEMFARFSPDGKTLAFTGEYDGNREVYSLSVNGGEPVRLTYTATNGRDDLGDRMGPNNIVMGWNPDGKSIIFRNRTSDSFSAYLWTIPAEGGMGERVPLPEGGFCCYSPDGKLLAYNRTFREFRTWKHYRGGQADDIWIWDPKAKTVKNVTNHEAQDIMPMWIGDEIFFISDRDHTMNLFVYNTKTQKTEKITNYTDYDVKFPSTNGKLIVYEQGGYIFRFDPATRQSVKINIQMNAEGNYARTEHKDVSKNVTAFSISEKGNRVAVTARGEVFNVPVYEGVTKNLTRTPGANERGGSISPDGKYIAYISDKTGETEVYLVTLETNEEKQLTRNSDTYIRSLFWSPDSKTLIYTDRKNRMVSLGIPGGTSKLLMQCPESEFRSVAFSPDSKWIAYTKPAKNTMSVIYVYNLLTGKEIAVTEKWYDSGSPIFSSDGKYLIYTASRDFSPTYGQLEWNYTYGNLSALYVTMLAKDTPSPQLPNDGENKNAPRKAGQEAGEKTAEGVNVVVDEEGIFSRVVKLTRGMGRPVYSDGKKVWYAGRGTNVVDMRTLEDENISSAQIAVVGKRAAFFDRRESKLYVLDNIPSGKVKLDKAVDLSHMYADVDYKQEWAQIFDEAWRAFRDGFYLENMHGYDWKAIRDRYAVLVPYARTRLDLNYIIGEMIGELTVGHCYVTPGEYAKPERIDMGLLGAQITRENNGYFRIGHIYLGAPYSKTLRSPLTEQGMNIKEGEYITAVDGISVKTTNNIYSLLVGKADVLTELTINSKAAEGGRKVVVRPIRDEYPLTHFEWVQKNIAYVDKASNGKIGYVYIPDMSQEGLNEFARYFYAQLDKEALIVDDRANGGGNVSPMILERLLREPYRMTMRRGSTIVGTIPDATLVGPKVCLVNKYSASDGDLFPWSFKATKAGKVIGTRTWGGIVGISGSLPYLDGTDIRVPFFTNYDYATGEWIVENHGVDPDIVIDNDPILEEQGIDQQLDKAIEVLLEELKTRKPVPPVPAPRNFAEKY